VIVVFVSTVAVLTLVINAPSTAALLQFFGMTATHDVTKLARKTLRGRVSAFANEKMSELAKESRWHAIAPEHQKKMLSCLTLLGKPDEKLYLTNKRSSAKAKRPPRVAARGQDTLEDTTGEQIKLVRAIFYRMLKQSYVAQANNGQLDSLDAFLALDLAHSVDAAADHPDEPLSDFAIALEALKIPVYDFWLFRIASALPFLRSVLTRRLSAQEAHIDGILDSLAVAHEDAQAHLREAFTTSDGKNEFVTEVDTVLDESARTLERVAAFEHDLLHCAESEVVKDAAEIANRLQTKAVATSLLSKVYQYIQDLQSFGAAEDDDVHALMHDLEHDQHVVKHEFSKTSDKAFESESMLEVMTAMNRVNAKHKEIVAKGSAPSAPSPNP